MRKGIFSPLTRFFGSFQDQLQINTSTTTASASFGTSATASPLVDLFGRRHDYLRISLTEKCNLRCSYCMPEEGVSLTPNELLLSSDEIFSLSSLFVNQLGVNKIRLTGGEPLVRNDFFEIATRLSALKSLGLKSLAVTTNGIALSRRMHLLKQSGVDAVNISLDTLQPQKFEFITKRTGWHLVMASIRSALELGFAHSVKVNVVVMRGLNDDEICDFVQLTESSPLDVRFIEYMPFDGNRWSSKKVVPFKEMLALITKKYPTVEPVWEEKDQSSRKLLLNPTSKPYRVKGFAGRIGFITSMTDNFCSSCNRLRITADGNLKVCLFGNEELSLRDLLRNGSSEEEIVEEMKLAIRRKRERHAGKIKTARMATARAIVLLGPELIARINHLPKGDVLSTAKIAGIFACKQTAHLIPLCHQIPLSEANIEISLDQESGKAIVECRVKTSHETGVEMEALIGATVASLTIYDMCKAVNKSIVIQEVKLIHKSGGQSDNVCNVS